MSKQTVPSIDHLSDLLSTKLNIKEQKSANKCMDKPKLLTEDTGKMFEMAICQAYNISYNGPYKYGYDLSDKLQPRLTKLLDLFAPQCAHTAHNQARYDFTAIIENNEHHLSAKTVKKGIAKVAPQVIGQATPQKLCNILQIEYTTDKDLKQYIQTNIQSILEFMIVHTFDCSNIYFHKEKDTIKYINITTPVNWNKYEYTWTKDWNNWNNSTVCKIITKTKPLPIAEFQFHSKSRKNMAIRWYYDNLLELCNEHFNVVNL